jgi:hypothetical protein
VPRRGRSVCPTGTCRERDRQLSIQLSSGSFSYAQTSSPGCSLPANTIDVLKGFLSVAQAAQLAGKNVVILFGSCFGNQYIYEIQMQH